MELSIKTSASMLLSILSCTIVMGGAHAWSEVNKVSMQAATKEFNASKVSVNDSILGKSFPNISAENQRSKQYDEFHPLQHVQVNDVYDDDLIQSVIAYGDVDVETKGEYEIRYVVANSYGLKSEKKIKVLVD